MKNCRTLFILIVNRTNCRSVYMKQYKHEPRIVVHIHTLRDRAFRLLRWSVVLLVGCGKTRAVLTIGFAGERRFPSIHRTHTFSNFFEDLLYLNTCKNIVLSDCIEFNTRHPVVVIICTISMYSHYYSTTYCKRYGIPECTTN